MKSNIGFETKLDAENLVFREAREEPFKIYGLYKPREMSYYCRMAPEVSEKVSPQVNSLNKNTSGGRIRFKTNSRHIAIHLVGKSRYQASHFTPIGSGGIDIYSEVDGRYRYVGTYHYKYEDFGHEGVLDLGSAREREIMIHMPLYNDVQDLYIGIDKDAALSEGKKYLPQAPIVYYGSSITQGGCASRPGNAYPAMIALENNIDFINLGFSGSARAEDPMIEYLSDLEMSVFVLDYDYNAPSLEHLENTHEKLFKAVRAKHPDLPVIMVSKPDFHTPELRGNSLETIILRRDVVYRTYLNAVKAGDKNVYFIDGARLFDGPLPDACTVDGGHPNDLGFMRMAQVIGGAVSRAVR